MLAPINPSVTCRDSIAVEPGHLDAALRLSGVVTGGQAGLPMMIRSGSGT